jgi:hypothetical protein
MLKLGKKPAQPARPQLRLTAAHLTALPAPPAEVDYGAGAYPMYGNDQYGDCVEAGIGHQVGQYTRYARGVEALFTDADILNAYSAITGFRADDPSTDQGTYTQDAMTWWRRTGLAGHRILMFASLDVADTTALKQAIELFGAVGIGFNFPASAMDQFDDGEPWTVVKGSPLEGGHYVIATGYDQDYLKVKTWGTQQLMAWPFHAAYTDEAWVVITAEMADSAGSSTFTGIDLYALGQDFATLTGQANPIPTPSPSPGPTPAPPSPSPDAADAAYAKVLKPWLNAPHVFNRHVVTAGKTWIHDKKL